MHWIKAYAGQEGNARADLLAKQGTLLPITSIPHTPSMQTSFPPPFPSLMSKMPANNRALKPGTYSGLTPHTIDKPKYSSRRWTLPKQSFPET